MAHTLIDKKREGSCDLSVLVPCFNEAPTVAAQIGRILAAPVGDMDVEVVVVDDGSIDGSAEIVDQLSRQDGRVRLVRHKKNRGKGVAVRSAIAASSGEMVVITDADLEYDPAEYSKLLAPIKTGLADVVYGSRFRGGEQGRVLYFWHSVANRILTLLSNMCTNLNLTDMECGFKAFRRDVIGRITLQEDRFGIEPEITAKLARLRPPLRIFEVGVSYSGRTYEEGKKITMKDAIRALYCVMRYSFSGDEPRLNDQPQQVKDVV